MAKEVKLKAASDNEPDETANETAGEPDKLTRSRCHEMCVEHLEAALNYLGMVPPKMQDGNLARCLQAFVDSREGSLEAIQRMKARGE